MIRDITEEEFGRLLATFSRSAFRLETRDAYALSYERPDFERFLAGHPAPPSEVGWWQPWLDQVAAQVAAGRTIGRVRLLAEPPTDYQRWLLWADPWHEAAGERIRYMPRSTARRLALPVLHDWWLLDDERVILMGFTDAGELDGKTLITGSQVTEYREWRDLAIRHATPAGEFAAA